LRKVEIFHLFPDVSIKKPSRYIAIPKTNKIIKAETISFNMVQSLLFEKLLNVFKILIDRYRRNPDKKLYNAIVASKLKAPEACVLKGLYKTVKPKTNNAIIKVPVTGFLII
jgi:hypothetical protein